MADWIDVRERLPENSGQWENYIVAVIHANGVGRMWRTNG